MCIDVGARKATTLLVLHSLSLLGKSYLLNKKNAKSPDLLPETLLHLVIELGPRHHFWGAITPDQGAFFFTN